MPPKLFSDEYHRDILCALEELRSIPGINRLDRKVRRLIKKIELHEQAGGDHPGLDYVSLDGALFELRTAKYLHGRKPERIEYEPPGLDRDGRRIEFVMDIGGSRIGIGCKATYPRSEPKRVPLEYFGPGSLTVNDLAYAWSSSARSHLMEFLLDTEDKFDNYNRFDRSVLCVFMNIYFDDWDLEYLWEFYRTGKPAQGDDFGRMMVYEMEREAREFRGTIDELWGLPFQQYGFEFAAGEDVYKFGRP